jgi:hypothetical protein
MSIPSGICYKWGGSGFGNNLILAHVVKILNDNGINAVLHNHRRIDGLLDVPIYNPEIHKDYLFHNGQTPNSTKVKNIDEPFIMQHIRMAEDIFEKRIYFDREKHNHIPVLFKEVEGIQKVDVVLATKSSPWGPVRDWKYFKELKAELIKNNLTYIDLNESFIYGNDCLTYVKKCKVYVGVETGTSHYVSKFANGKGLIIQSGFAPFYVWAFPYDYKPIVANVDCVFRPCFLDKKRLEEGNTCPFNERCINNITVDMVMKEILKLWKK